MKHRWIPWAITAVAVGVALWSWWLGPGAETSTITIDGTGTVKAVPSEFVFRPQYRVNDPDSSTATSRVSEIGNGIVDKLVELGVPREKVTTRVYVNQDYSVLTPEGKPQDGATYELTATVNDADLAKRVLDYLATTDTLYDLSPESRFGDTQNKELEREARRLALRDARVKAEDAADELGGRLGRVKSVGNQYWGGPIAYSTLAESVSGEPGTGPTTTAPYLLTGEQELSYSVTVEFSLR